MMAVTTWLLVLGRFTLSLVRKQDVTYEVIKGSFCRGTWMNAVWGGRSFSRGSTGFLISYHHPRSTAWEPNINT